MLHRIASEKALTRKNTRKKMLGNSAYIPTFSGLFNNPCASRLLKFSWMRLSWLLESWDRTP